MTPLESKSLDAMGKLSSSWNKFLVSVEGPTLGALNKGMTALTQLMKPLGAFIKPVAKALGDVFAQIGKAGSSKGMVAFANTMGKLSGSLLKKAVPILGDLATGFKTLLLAFLPVGTDMVGGLGKLAKRFADWSATVGKSQGFRSFIDYVRENGPKLMSTIGDVVTAVVNLGVALAPLASKVLAGVSAFAKWLSGFSKAHPTIIRVVAGVIALSSGLSALAGPASKVIGLIRVAATVFRVLSAVLLTNPIGLIVTAIVGLGIALVVAYKKSETFRKIVDAAFNAIGRAARWLWNKAIAPMVRFIIGGFAAIADKIGDMLDALSHIPGFGWAKAAADKMHGAARGARALADKIRDIPTHHSTRLDINWQSAKLGVQQVQSAINALHDRHVTITVSQRNLFNRQAAMAGAMHHASGGTVAGQRRPYGDKVLTALAPGEEVISNRRGQADRHRNLLKMINAGALADGGTVRPILFAQGGVGKAAGGTITKPAAFARTGADGQQGPLVQVVAGPHQTEQEIGTIAARQVMWGLR